MSISEITAELNENKWFKKKDNSDICDFQVHGRTWSNSKLFRRDGNMVYLTDENTN
ncbi:MAG: hypothetical protein PF450_05235 [Bacteroidales bacterium]|nr:hypothetical protein [Bacteroidales bacterium]